MYSQHNDLRWLEGVGKKTCLLFWPVPNDRNLMCNNEGRFSMSACGISYPTGRICFCKIKWSSISRPLLYLWYKAAVLILNIFTPFPHRSHWVALRGHALNGEKKAAQASCRKSLAFYSRKANSQRFRIWYPMDCRESWWEPMALEPA